MTGVERELEGQAHSALGGLDRRALLRGLGATAALGLLPSACGAPPAALVPPAGVVPRALTPRGWAVLGAAARSIVGPGGAALIDAGTVDVAGRADAFLAGAPELAEPVGGALLLLEFGIWPVLGKLRPFTALPEAARSAVLAECMASRLELKRRIFAGVRALALLSFYAAPEARALARYPGAPGVPAVPIEAAMNY